MITKYFTESVRYSRFPVSLRCKSELLCFVSDLKRNNFGFTDFKTNFVCIKPIYQVFQVIINMFVHLFDGMTEI